MRPVKNTLLRIGRRCRALGAILLALLAGCTANVPDSALVLTQVPASAREVKGAQTVLDERYPAGSRVVLAIPPFNPDNVRVLSKGLIAAGDVVVCPDAKRVFFAGKAEASGAWQIYESRLTESKPKRITSIEGGAMNPAVNAKNHLIFSAPVPKPGQTWTTDRPAALYAQELGAKPRRLTFGLTAAVEPTVLEDGKILFVSARHGGRLLDGLPRLALFTINSDGSELTSFALHNDGAPLVRRPRELPDGRIGFLAADQEGTLALRAEGVTTARPFLSRAPLWEFSTDGCSSVEAGGNGTWLACFETGGTPVSSVRSFAVHRVSRSMNAPGEPLFDDPAWDEIEAVATAGRVRPMGHISAMMPGKSTGTILCLDAHLTRASTNLGVTYTKAERVRILVPDGPGKTRVLGEIPLHEDGSFMAEVPADIPLGLETIDGQGEVVQRLPAAVWVRPGENRACIGCHEPYNRSPRNLRPIAVTKPPAALTNGIRTVARSDR